MFGLVNAIEKLLSMNIISKDSYEMALVGNRVTFLVKFESEKGIDFASLSELVKEDKLLHNDGKYFVFKMVFLVNTGAFLPGEFSIIFSTDLTGMLPELANYSQPGLGAKLALDLVSFLMYVKDNVNKDLINAVEKWKTRANLLLRLLSIFEDGVLAVPYLDSSTMSTMDLAFTTKVRRVMVKVELPVGYPEDIPKVTAYSVLIPEEEASETWGSAEIMETVIDLVKLGYEPNMKEGEIVEIVMQIINRIVNCYS